uniref:Integrase, catalytic region, zinc finger, CCHC-type, peptidase aspartic, catalytic n=1 Tax=Tanacetum cinerariifolium TaxID=118510 RepID=A0A6L2JRK0_TANCI|nr:hypothetical protein [Tanacetum cinerariifolium]
MANLSEDIQCAGSNTRPPMLDRTHFASWQQRIRLYCRGKENGVSILKSIDEGPFRMGTLREILTEGTEDALHLGPERPRVYSDITSEEKDRFVTAVKLNRGLKDSNYDQLYAYLKQHEHYPQSSTTSPSTNVQPHTTQLDSGDSPTDNLIENLTNTLTLLTQSYKTYLPQTHNQLGTSSNPKNQTTIQDGRVVVQNVQGRQNRGQGNNARGAGGQDNAIDEDVNEQPVQDLTLNVNNVFQAVMLLILMLMRPLLHRLCSWLIYHPHILFMMKPVHEMHGDVQPNYVVDSHTDYTSDSNMIPYDQTRYDKSLTVELATYKEQVELYERRVRFELTKREQIDEQLKIVITDRNIKEENLKKELHSVKMQLAFTINHNKSMVEEVTSLKNDFKHKENKYLEEFLDMKALKENVEDKLFKQDQSLQTVQMLCKPKPYYDEQRKVAIGYKSPLCLVRAKQVQHALYNSHEIIKTDFPTIVYNSEDTLEMAEITRKKMNEKMKTPLWTHNKINIRPPDYSKENFLATFTPQTQLTPEQIFLVQRRP